MKASFEHMPPLIEPLGGASVTGQAEGGMIVTRTHFPAGVDLASILPGGRCPVPHWGYVLEGAVT
jgi:hypothetical protein